MSVAIRNADRFRPPGRVRFNPEPFGFLVGFPDGEILMTNPAAVGVIRDDVARSELDPYVLESLEVDRGFHLETPPLAWLELTRRCNLACPHCYIDAGKPRASEMPASRWFTLLDEMADMGVWAVAFTGGEPTLHPAFCELVQHARRRDLLVGIATHGMFLSDEMLARLPVEGVIISVSIDNLHLGKRGAGTTVEQGKAAILRAQARGFMTNVMTNSHKLNLIGLEDLVGWAGQHGVSVRSVPMSPIGRGKLHPELLHTADDALAAAKFWLDECELEHAYHREAGLCVGSIFNYGLSFAYMTRRCASGRYLGYVAADGTLFPCTMCAGEGIFESGSIRSRPFHEAWRADWPIRDMSWDNFKETCNGCPVNDERHYCAARCPALSHARNGILTGCGASAFEINSTLIRTELLEKTDTGRQSNKPMKIRLYRDTDAQ